MADNKAKLQDMIDGIQSGKLMEKFEQYYADDVFMSENGRDEPNRHGKEANRQYEQYFVDNAEFHDVKVGPVIGDGNITGYEMWMDITFGGQRMQRLQWATQEWKDGKIVKEVFFYNE